LHLISAAPCSYDPSTTSAFTTPLIYIIGLGYVGLSLAVEFGQQHLVIVFAPARIAELRAGRETTPEAKAIDISYHPEVIPAGRSISDRRVGHVAETVVKRKQQSGIDVCNSRDLIYDVKAVLHADQVDGRL
jgi:hypothetical protein